MAVVVFLRGMNLGNRRITNRELVSILTGAGHTNVSAYQASGNVVLGDTETVDAAHISRVLAAALGYEVPTFVRTADTIAAIASASPIRDRVGAAGGKPQVVFLGESVETDLAAVFPDDHEVHRIGDELHWLPPTGLAALTPLLRTMDVRFGPTTVRTLGTIDRLAARMR